MIDDRELESWKEEWSRAAEVSPDFRRKVRQKIGRQNQRFVVGNMVTGIVFVGIMILAAFVQKEANWMGPGWSTGICILVLVSVALRVWNLRRMWRTEAQSTRAFLELWRKRVEARLRLLRISIYVS